MLIILRSETLKPIYNWFSINCVLDIPVIPDVEELQDDDQLGDIADAPVYDNYFLWYFIH